MSTNKNDYYHLGLTDDEVLQSREKNGINLLTPPSVLLSGNFIWKNLKTRLSVYY